MAKILFIDDDTQTLALMEREAEILGHVAFLCPMASEALQYVLEFNPDLVMIDVNMQEINGFDVVRQLRSTKLTKNLSIIIISAGDPDIDGAKSLEAGANGFLQKPLSIMNMDDAVKQNTNHKKPVK
jgi:DNA-binding response OmpR family regulator